ncbi:MAG: YdbL family protein [Phenylobacterium sp.]|uniref:YdbL family protein n=1 Tax=Phenylobacterium sp. TaxID=1871053 RepID=UPI002732D582|nr:YdbL family protein [Phenylobacterium sp.]MDP3173094.1 YdbL family protein [Phenylobacterium sp.]
MRRRNLIAAIAGAAGAMLLVTAAAGQTGAKAVVDQAKAQGAVGEQSDGYLGFVRGPSDAAVKAAVDEINAGRAQLYREAAARNGVTPQAAGAATFQQVVTLKLQPGEYYRTPDGRWVRK